MSGDFTIAPGGWRPGLVHGLGLTIDRIIEVDISRDKVAGEYNCLKIVFKTENDDSGHITLFFDDPKIKEVKVRWPGKALRKLKGSVVERMKFTRGDKVKE